MSNDDIERDSEFEMMSQMTDEELMINYFDLIENEMNKDKALILLPDANI